jgi:long-chain fatty acid transport protein
MGQKRTLIITALLIALSGFTYANGLSLNSVGSRALGMGGAFIGLANDATALYWNPAGLAGQRSSVLIFGTDVVPLTTYKMDAAHVDATGITNHYISPNVIFNYNFGKLSLALGAYVPAGLGTEWDGKELLGLTSIDLNGDGVPDMVLGPFEWMSKIGVMNFSPAVAYKVSDNFSIGLAINVYYATFELKRPHDDMLDTNGDNRPDTLPQYEEESTGLGYGATIGLKYVVNKQLSFGASFRTSTKVTMSGTAKLTGITESDFDRDVTWPMWVGAGLAFKPNEKMTITLDGQYSNWSSLDKMVAEYKDWHSNGEFVMNWESKLQIRTGFEHSVNEAFTYRVGYYYDPAPAPDETVNILFPSSTNHVATVGASFKTGNFCFTGAFEHLFGAERNIKMNAVNAMPGIHQMDVNAFSLGITYLLK